MKTIFRQAALPRSVNDADEATNYDERIFRKRLLQNGLNNDDIDFLIDAYHRKGKGRIVSNHSSIDFSALTSERHSVKQYHVFLPGHWSSNELMTLHLVSRIKPPVQTTTLMPSACRFGGGSVPLTFWNMDSILNVDSVSQFANLDLHREVMNNSKYRIVLKPLLCPNISSRHFMYMSPFVFDVTDSSATTSSVASSPRIYLKLSPLINPSAKDFNLSPLSEFYTHAALITPVTTKAPRRKSFPSDARAKSGQCSNPGKTIQQMRRRIPPKQQTLVDRDKSNFSAVLQ
jgi:hypothetical protein